MLCNKQEVKYSVNHVSYLLLWNGTHLHGQKLWLLKEIECRLGSLMVAAAVLGSL
jgi:hypothetical protein